MLLVTDVYSMIILKIFTCDLTPPNSTLKRFLEDDTKTLVFKKIFIYTIFKLFKNSMEYVDCEADCKKRIII
jgi:hypothetical protein